VAARAALAAREQGKYRQMHEALMSETGSFGQDKIEKIASKVGLDFEKLKKDMESPAIAEALKKNQALAEALGVNSTPSFVIGPALIVGAPDPAQFESLISEAQGQPEPPKK
jgi:protein-disulfide isomerase